MDALPQRGIFLFDGFHLDHRGLFRRDERGVLTPVAIGGRALDLLWALIVDTSISGRRVAASSIPSSQPARSR